MFRLLFDLLLFQSLLNVELVLPSSVKMIDILVDSHLPVTFCCDSELSQKRVWLRLAYRSIKLLVLLKSFVEPRLADDTFYERS